MTTPNSHAARGRATQAVTSNSDSTAHGLTDKPRKPANDVSQSRFPSPRERFEELQRHRKIRSATAKQTDPQMPSTSSGYGSTSQPAPSFITFRSPSLSAVSGNN